MRLEKAIREARKLAEAKTDSHQDADEFVEIGNADGFKIYVAAAKTVSSLRQQVFHENPGDVFMLLLEGEIEFTFAKGEKVTVKAGEYFVLPKHVKHRCVFRKMTVAIEGVYETGL
jgi:mannose-6-phosphate isomerase-like protein (cupin superfamily)